MWQQRQSLSVCIWFQDVLQFTPRVKCPCAPTLPPLTSPEIWQFKRRWTYNAYQQTWRHGLHVPRWFFGFFVARAGSSWLKEPPLPGGVSCQVTMFPDQQTGGRWPPSKNLYHVLRGGPVPPGSWSGNIVNRKTPRGGGFLSIKVSTRFQVLLDLLQMGPTSNEIDFKRNWGRLQTKSTSNENVEIPQWAVGCRNRRIPGIPQILPESRSTEIQRWAIICGTKFLFWRYEIICIQTCLDKKSFVFLSRGFRLSKQSHHRLQNDVAGGPSLAVAGEFRIGHKSSTPVCAGTYMGWLQLVGSIKLKVSFAKENYKRDAILQKRTTI